MVKRNLFIQIIIEIILGLLFLIFPTRFQEFIVYTIGGLIIIYGGIKLYYQYKNHDQNYMVLSGGILNILFGIIIMLLNDLIVSLIPILVALFFILKGITKVSLNYLNRLNNPLWVLNIILGSITIILGVSLIILSNASDFVGYFIGGLILLNAIFDILTFFNLKKYATQDDLHSDSKIKDNVIDATYTEKRDD